MTLPRPSSRLPVGDRIPHRDRLFFDEYREDFRDATNEVYLAYGDTIIILKKLKTPHRTIDTSGGAVQQSLRGKFGGRRVTRPQEHGPDNDEIYARPEFDSSITVPAIVNIHPTETERLQFGVGDADSSLVHIARKWVEDRAINIDRAEDLLVYDNVRYLIKSKVPGGNFLDSKSEDVYIISTKGVS